MEEKVVSKEQFSVVKRAKSFTHAGRGLWIFLRSTPNAWIHLVALAIVIGLGLFFHITVTEWLAIVIVSAFVFAAEAFNTAIEIDIDLTSPDYHPYARDTKDVAAGAVLIAAGAAAVVFLLIFGRYLL